MKKMNALAAGGLYLCLMIGTSSCAPTGTMRADTLTDDINTVEVDEGVTTCKELYVIYHANKVLIKAANKERAQMRKHSTTDDPWWKVW